MNSDSPITKYEIISAVLRFSVLTVGTFLTVRWVFNQIDPTKTQRKSAIKRAQAQLKKIGIKTIQELSDYEMMIASHLVDPSDITISWANIAGLDDVIQELKETVILPVQRKDLFENSSLTQAPKGVLMHGPPGCGKTLIAKATAREAGMRFINLDVSLLTDKWYGESQKLAAAVFSLAIKLQPCIIFIDEIDSFLRSRNSHDHEATAMMKAQFMSLWDGLITDPDCTVIVMGATNRPQDLDRAILRRMPATFSIRLPNSEQRAQILRLVLHGEPLGDDVDITRLSQQTEGFSGSDLREICRNASIYRVRDFLRANADRAIDEDDNIFHDTLRAITMSDLVVSLRKMKESKVQCGTLVVE